MDNHRRFTDIAKKALKAAQQADDDHSGALEQLRLLSLELNQATAPLELSARNVSSM